MYVDMTAITIQSNKIVLNEGKVLLEHIMGVGWVNRLFGQPKYCNFLYNFMLWFIP